MLCTMNTEESRYLFRSCGAKQIDVVLISIGALMPIALRLPDYLIRSIL